MLIIIISIGVVLFIVGTVVGGIICCAVYHYCLLGKKQGKFLHYNNVYKQHTWSTHIITLNKCWYNTLQKLNY